MSTGFERIGSDSHLQDHWIRRLLAFIIDSIIVSIGTLIIAGVISIPLVIAAVSTGFPWFLFNPFALPFFVGVLSVLYFTLLESLYGWTFGKKIMNLKTTASPRGRTIDQRRPPLDAAFIRNISKVYWILTLIDVVIGLATSGDPQQKISDRIVGTTVVSATSPPSSLPPSTS